LRKRSRTGVLCGKVLCFDLRLSVLICEISGKGFLLSGHGDVGYPGYYLCPSVVKFLGFKFWQLPDFGNLVFTCQARQAVPQSDPQCEIGSLISVSCRSNSRSLSLARSYIGDAVSSAIMILYNNVHCMSTNYFINIHTVYSLSSRPRAERPQGGEAGVEGSLHFCPVPCRIREFYQFHLSQKRVLLSDHARSRRCRRSPGCRQAQLFWACWGGITAIHPPCHPDRNPNDRRDVTCIGRYTT
jgi:hypothetical protein